MAGGWASLHVASVCDPLESGSQMVVARLLVCSHPWPGVPFSLALHHSLHVLHRSSGDLYQGTLAQQIVVPRHLEMSRAACLGLGSNPFPKSGNPELVVWTGGLGRTSFPICREVLLATSDYTEPARPHEMGNHRKSSFRGVDLVTSRPNLKIPAVSFPDPSTSICLSIVTNSSVGKGNLSLLDVF